MVAGVERYHPRRHCFVGLRYDGVIQEGAVLMRWSRDQLFAVNVEYCLVSGCAKQVSESTEEGGFNLLAALEGFALELGAQALAAAIYHTVAISTAGDLGIGSVQARLGFIHFIDSINNYVVVHRCVRFKE